MSFELSRRLAASHFSLKCRCLVAAALGLAASPAAAQVMNIAPDGTVSIRQGSGASTWEVVSPANKAADGTDAPLLPAYAYTDVTLASIPPQYALALRNAAVAANVSPALLAAVVWQESRWNPEAISGKGAIGLAQLMPATARELGVDPTDPVANLNGGARYLRRLLDQFGGNVEEALAAYNAGAGRVRSAAGIPPITETRKYVASIVGHMSSFSTGESQ